MTKRYQIVATIEAEDGYDCYVGAWFGDDSGGGVLSKLFATPEEADAAAHAAYLGPDSEGVGATWTVEEISDDA